MMESPYKGKTGLRRLINALGYSMEGFKSAYQYEDALRQEVWLGVVLIPLAFYLRNSAIERAIMVASVILVIIIELINSSIEATVDHTSLKKHPLAKRAKDIGSAAVLLSLINLVVVWSLIIFD
jgi:diacylglycerol kinase (ATP)